MHGCPQWEGYPDCQNGRKVDLRLTSGTADAALLLPSARLGDPSTPLGLTPAVRLLITTGFLGGLTPFSTFSAETVTLLLRAQYAWAAVAAAVHLGGSLSMTGLGVLLARGLLKKLLPA